MTSTGNINHSLYPNSTKDTNSTYEDIKNNHLLEEFLSLVNTIYNARNKKIF